MIDIEMIIDDFISLAVSSLYGHYVNSVLDGGVCCRACMGVVTQRMTQRTPPPAAHPCSRSTAACLSLWGAWKPPSFSSSRWGRRDFSGGVVLNALQLGTLT